MTPQGRTAGNARTVAWHKEGERDAEDDRIMTAAGLMAPIAAHALNERVRLMINGGGGTYLMSDLNNEIAAVNAAYAGTGWSFPLIKGGTSFGGSMGFETPGRWNFGMGLDRLDATTKASDANGALECRFTANAWRAFGEYALRPLGRSSLFVGGAIGIVSESGKAIESTPTSAPLEYKIGGSDPLCEAYVGGNWWPTPQFAPWRPPSAIAIPVWAR